MHVCFWEVVLVSEGDLLGVALECRVVGMGSRSGLGFGSAGRVHVLAG